MKAILTRYHPPTDRLPARMSARAEGGHRVFTRYLDEVEDRLPNGANRDRSHALAAKTLRDSMGEGWAVPMVGGTLPNGDRAWVFVNDERID